MGIQRALKTIKDADLPPEIARDAEFQAADAVHSAASDPHTQYLNNTRGDARYEYRAGIASKMIAGPQNYPANTWSSLGSFAAFAPGVQGTPSAILAAISFCFDSVAPWQQACCAGLLGPVWWQSSVVNDNGTRIFLEVHNTSGFFLFLRFGVGQGLRPLQIYPESLITIPSSGFVNVTLRRFI